MSYILSAATPPPLIIHLDSRFASQYLENDANGRPLSTNYIYVMREPVVVPEHMNLLISLHTATIPYSFYNVRTGVNDKVYYTSAGSDGDITLTHGNYSATGLITELKTKLEAEIGGGFSISTTYSRETIKFTYTVTGVASFIFKFSNTTASAADLLGFYDGEDTAMTIGVGTLSEKAIDLNDSIHGLYIRQNIATKGTLDNEQGTFSNILARLPISTNAGGIIFYSPSDNDHETMVSAPLIQTIGVKLTDDRNRAIDLNGLHWQMSFKISYIHKETLREPPPRRYRPQNEELKIKSRTKQRQKK